MIWTHKATALIIATLIALLVAWNTGVVLFYALTAFLLCLLTFAFVATFMSPFSLEVIRSIADTAYEDEPLTVVVTIGNKQFFPRFFIRLYDTIGNVSPDEKPPTCFIPFLGAHQQYEWTYSFRCFYRGHHTIGPLISLSSDLLGVFYRKRPFGFKTTLIVYPGVFDISYFPRPSRGIIPWFGLESGKHAGDSGDFFGIREYRRGDSIKRIHWKSVARYNRLTVKQYERTSADEITLVLDVSAHTNIGFGKEKLSEYAIRIAASLARYLISKGTMVQVIINTEQMMYIPFGKGESHFYDILDKLATVPIGGTRSMNEVLQEINPMIPSHSSLTVIMPDFEYEGTWKLLDFVQRHVSPVVVLLDSSSFSEYELIDPTERMTSKVKTGRGFNAPMVMINQGDNLQEKFRNFSWSLK